MTPGFRYHVVSLAATFLALGVGIIIGTSFVQSAIVDRQTRLLQGLRQQFLNEAEVRKSEIRDLNAFVSSVSPLLTAERLTGIRVVIIQTGDYPDAVRSARDTIETAGGRVTGVIAFDRSFTTRVSASAKRLSEALRENHPNEQFNSNAICKLIADTASQGDPKGDLPILQRIGLIKTDGDYASTSDAVVIVGGAEIEYDGREEALDIPLITELIARKTLTVAAESKSAAISTVDAWQRTGCTSVDNVDTEMGKVSLVFALRGAKGHFGSKPTASSGMIPSKVPNDLRRHTSP